MVERSATKGERLHISLPGFPVRLELVDDVGDVNGGVVVAVDSVQGT